MGVIGGSGGLYIIPAILQVFLNHFTLAMEPLSAVQGPRVYHKVHLLDLPGCMLASVRMLTAYLTCLSKKLLTD